MLQWIQTKIQTDRHERLFILGIGEKLHKSPELKSN